jgi:hypothetical protein
LDRFERRLRAELHGEFDSQAVDTPPPHRARYARLRAPARRLPPLRVTALVTAVFAIGVLVGLVYNAQRAATPGPGHGLGAVPPSVASTRTAAAITSRPATASPSARASSRPTTRPLQSPEPSAASTPPALADDFTADPVGADPPAGWQVGDGRWTGVVDDGGHVVRHDASQPLAHLVAGWPGWTDYAVGADVSTGLLDLGFAGVAGRYQDPGDDYECVLGVGGQLQLWVVQAGSRRLLASTSLSLDLGTRHAVVLDMRGSRLTCSLDGSPLLRASDATYGAGRIALIASSGEAAEFGDVRVTG